MTLIARLWHFFFGCSECGGKRWLKYDDGGHTVTVPCHLCNRRKT